MATPPDIRSLMEDPIYRAYMRTPPDPYVIYAGTTRPHPALTMGEPWQVWVQVGDTKWKTGRFTSYADAFNMMARAVKANVLDAVLVSRRVFFPPPGEWEEYKVRVRDPRTKGIRIEVRERWVQTFHWDDIRLEWCPRCRRPSEFRRLHWTHHALRSQPCLTDDDPYRCMYCGIRRAAVPDIATLVR
jgi:hypothetical protein